MSLNNKQIALEYHSLPTPGKLEVVPSKPSRNQQELSIAFTAARSLKEAVKGADVFFCVTIKGAVTSAMLQSMAGGAGRGNGGGACGHAL